MKFYIFFLIAAIAIIYSKSVDANPDYDYPDTLNSNSIYRNNEQASVHTDHSNLGPLHKDTSVVKDANGNVQESTKIYAHASSSKCNLNFGLCLILLFAGHMYKYY